jgi:hypothetical protein
VEKTSCKSGCSMFSVLTSVGIKKVSYVVIPNSGQNVRINGVDHYLGHNG